MLACAVQSTGDAVLEVMAGRGAAMIGANIAVMPYASDSRVRLLGVTTSARSKFLADLPTLSESGLRGYQFDSWLGLLAPAATPRDIVDRMNAEVGKQLRNPDVAERLAKQGIETRAMTPEQMNEIRSPSISAHGQVVKIAGAQAYYDGGISCIYGICLDAEAIGSARRRKTRSGRCCCRMAHTQSAKNSAPRPSIRSIGMRLGDVSSCLAGITAIVIPFDRRDTPPRARDCQSWARPQAAGHFVGAGGKVRARARHGIVVEHHRCQAGRMAFAIVGVVGPHARLFAGDRDHDLGQFFPTACARIAMCATASRCRWSSCRSNGTSPT